MTTIFVIILIIWGVLYMSRQAKKDNPSQLYYMIKGIAEVDISEIEPINNYPSKRQIKKAKKQRKKEQRKMRHMAYTHVTLKNLNDFMK